MTSKIFILARILVGSVFLVSGFQKLIGPYQNFLYVVQTYAFLPVVLEEVVARGLPWIELFLGLFLVCGLWIRWTLRFTILLFVMFIGVVGQALVRGLPIDECGCFGSLITIPPAGVMALDATMLGLCGLMLKKPDYTSIFSFDRYFNQ